MVAIPQTEATGCGQQPSRLRGTVEAGPCSAVPGCRDGGIPRLEPTDTWRGGAVSSLGKGRESPQASRMEGATLTPYGVGQSRMCGLGEV